ncbi:MAG: hypothetical protein A2087_08365 [Spirochaetes bacterium GWD1_61_31]|nr:MAG: hypothetical protein A2Y37_02410 [Spirochaetes bacterium GWB1_60_80]OHD33476.1 MAG: hypothetical protein A2004_01155 [Spirochaetes bacterium GWC1_61_12]OHD34763.1 MAG: hypothetical protein A2087_08365 [Spirochaetes bacterium GWD1_61_31]OHD45471.1 MAG: hypothetical protein A2Y35_02680 [Spirochaetes bacterium GWE1_60_18]OHD58043.1 MAG: hypothetical protein A2Y32_05255 [Spirochaetes bacterium GWF1_60_12]
MYVNAQVSAAPCWPPLTALPLLALVLALVFLANACSAPPPATITLYNGPQPEHFDVLYGNSPQELAVSGALFDSLVVYDQAGLALQPGLAGSWELAADGRTASFQLRRSAWSDGQPLDAASIIAGWLAVLEYSGQTAWQAEFAALVDGVSAWQAGRQPLKAIGLAAPERRRLTIRLADGADSCRLLDALAGQAFRLRPANLPYADQPASLLSSGPYRWSPDVPAPDPAAIDLLPNPHHPAYRELRRLRLRFRFGPLQPSLLDDLVNGQVTALLGVPSDFGQRLSAAADGWLVPVGQQFIWLQYNLRQPQLADRAVRQRLNQAIAGWQLPSPLPEAGAYRPMVQASLTLPAGQPEPPASANPTNPAPAGPIGLRLLYQSSPALERIALELQRRWQDQLGVSIELRPEGENVLKAIADVARDFDILLSEENQAAFGSSGFLSRFTSAAWANRGHYQAPDFDCLLRQAQWGKSPAEREANLASAISLLLEVDSAIAPLYQQPRLMLADTTRWQGWRGNPDGTIQYQFLRRRP